MKIRGFQTDFDLKTIGFGLKSRIPNQGLITDFSHHAKPLSEPVRHASNLWFSILERYVKCPFNKENHKLLACLTVSECGLRGGMEK